MDNDLWRILLGDTGKLQQESMVNVVQHDNDLHDPIRTHNTPCCCPVAQTVWVGLGCQQHLQPVELGTVKSSMTL